MEYRGAPHTTPFPGVIKAIKDGCNLVANKFYLMIPPIILDLFLLFGPKLRVSELFAPVLDSAMKQLRLSSSSTGLRQMELVMELLEQALGSVNLFGFLRTRPIGIGVIFSSSGSTTPLGTSSTVQTTSPLLVLLLIAVMLILGVILGTFYYSAIASAVNEKKKFSWADFGKQLLNVILLYIALIILIVILAVPFICLMTFIYMTIPVLYQIFSLILIFFACWLLVPLFFIPHGIFVGNLDFPKAVKESFQTASWSGMVIIRFIMITLLVSLGLDMVWTIPEQSSWLILFSIFGHAFVSTALLSSSFILYREIIKWGRENQSFLEWRKANLRIKHFIKKEPETHE